MILLTSAQPFPNENTNIIQYKNTTIFCPLNSEQFIICYINNIFIFYSWIPEI